MSDYIWEFPASHRTQKIGESGSGLDQFSNKPLNNLAREIIQNSLDARIDGKCARVQFHLFSTDNTDFPGIESFSSYLMDLYNENRNKPNNDKAKLFADHLLTQIRQKKMWWLRVSDFNTTGLWGSSDRNDHDTPWFAFNKGSGKTEKSDKSGGAKGLGKNAIFANSTIRTILVSTFTKNLKNNNVEKAFIGIAKLASKTLKSNDPSIDDDWTQGIGFYIKNDENSKTNLSPSAGMIHLDPEFDRETMGYGTDIYIPCFASDDWENTIIIEAIQSFLPAIMDKELQIILSYDDTTEQKIINNDTITNFLIGKGWGKREARALYNLYKSPSKTVVNFDSKPGFEMQLLLLQDQANGLGEVYEYRLPTKMKIQSARVPSSVNYTGILLIKGEKLCKRLRSVEDATHSGWSVSRFRDTEFKKQEIEEAINTVKRFLEEQCEKFGANGVTEETFINIEGWNSNEETYDMSVGEQRKEIGLPTEEMTFDRNDDVIINNNRPKKKKGNVVDDKGEAENEVNDLGAPGKPGEELIHTKGKRNGGINPNDKDKTYDPNEGEEEVITRRRISVLKARTPSVDPKNGIFDLVFISGKTGTETSIELVKSGVDGEAENTKILSAVYDGKSLDVSDNKIILGDVEKGKEYRIKLKLNENINYIWEVNMYAKD